MGTWTDRLDDLSIPIDKALLILKYFSLKFPDLAGALGQIATKIGAAPAEILTIPLVLPKELKELIETGESELPPDIFD